MFAMTSNPARALLCGVVALVAAYPCFAPVSSTSPPSDEAERRMLELNDVGIAHYRHVEFAAARSTYEEAIRLKPEPGDVVSSKARRWLQTNLAWLLATCSEGAVRDGARAVTLAEEVVGSAPNDAAYLDTLAAAYAEAGRFHDAVNTERQALALLKKGTSLNDRFRDHLKRYKAGQPWRDDGSNW